MEIIKILCLLMLYWFDLCSSDSEPRHLPRRYATIIEPNSCLTFPSSNGEVFTYINSTCVCRMMEPGTGHDVEWFDTTLAVPLASGALEAKLFISMKFVGQESSTVCRVKNRFTGEGQTSLPPITVSPMKVNITFRERGKNTGPLYINKDCPSQVFLTCSVPERHVIPQAYSRVNITVLDEEGNTSTLVQYGKQNRTSNGAFHFDYRLPVDKPGRWFLRCMATYTVNRVIVDAGFQDFVVIEETLNPSIVAREYAISATPWDDFVIVKHGDILSLVCSVPYPWNKSTVYRVAFECGWHEKLSDGVNTALQFPVTESLDQEYCVCRVTYYECANMKEARLRIVVGEQATFSNKSSINGTDEEAGNTDDNDAGSNDDLRLILVVTGMFIAILLAAIVFYCIGLKVGSKKKKKKYSIDARRHQQSAESIPNYADLTKKEPVEDAYGENIKMVRLKPNLVYSFSKEDYLDPVDMPMKLPGQHQQQQSEDEEQQQQQQQQKQQQQQSYHTSTHRKDSKAGSPLVPHKPLKSKQEHIIVLQEDNYAVPTNAQYPALPTPEPHPDRKTSSSSKTLDRLSYAKVKKPPREKYHTYDNNFVSKLHEKLKGSKKNKNKSKDEKTTKAAKSAEQQEQDIDNTADIVSGHNDPCQTQDMSHSQFESYENQSEGNYEPMDSSQYFSSNVKDETKSKIKKVKKKEHKEKKDQKQNKQLSENENENIYQCPSNRSVEDIKVKDGKAGKPKKKKKNKEDEVEVNENVYENHSNLSVEDLSVKDDKSGKLKKKKKKGDKAATNDNIYENPSDRSHDNESKTKKLKKKKKDKKDKTKSNDSFYECPSNRSVEDLKFNQNKAVTPETGSKNQIDESPLNENIYECPSNRSLEDLHTIPSTNDDEGVYENNPHGMCARMQSNNTEQTHGTQTETSNVNLNAEPGIYECPSNGSTHNINNMQGTDDDNNIYKNDQGDNIYERPSSSATFGDSF